MLAKVHFRTRFGPDSNTHTELLHMRLGQSVGGKAEWKETAGVGGGGLNNGEFDKLCPSPKTIT